MFSRKYPRTEKYHLLLNEQYLNGDKRRQRRSALLICTVTSLVLFALILGLIWRNLALEESKARLTEHGMEMANDVAVHAQNVKKIYVKSKIANSSRRKRREVSLSEQSTQKEEEEQPEKKKLPKIIMEYYSKLINRQDGNSNVTISKKEKNVKENGNLLKDIGPELYPKLQTLPLNLIHHYFLLLQELYKCGNDIDQLPLNNGSIAKTFVDLVSSYIDEPGKNIESDTTAIGEIRIDNEKSLNESLKSNDEETLLNRNYTATSDNTNEVAMNKPKNDSTSDFSNEQENSENVKLFSELTDVINDENKIIINKSITINVTRESLNIENMENNSSVLNNSDYNDSNSNINNTDTNYGNNLFQKEKLLASSIISSNHETMIAIPNRQFSDTKASSIRKKISSSLRISPMITKHQTVTVTSKLLEKNRSPKISPSIKTQSIKPTSADSMDSSMDSTISFDTVGLPHSNIVPATKSKTLHNTISHIQPVKSLSYQSQSTSTSLQKSIEATSLNTTKRQNRTLSTDKENQDQGSFNMTESLEIETLNNTVNLELPDNSFNFTESNFTNLFNNESTIPFNTLEQNISENINTSINTNLNISESKLRNISLDNIEIKPLLPDIIENSTDENSWSNFTIFTTMRPTTVIIKEDSFEMFGENNEISVHEKIEQFIKTDENKENDKRMGPGVVLFLKRLLSKIKNNELIIGNEKAKKVDVPSFQISSKCRNDTNEWSTSYLIGMSRFLSNQLIKCKHNEYLKDFQLTENRAQFFPLFRYEYTCCKLILEQIKEDNKEHSQLEEES